METEYLQFHSKYNSYIHRDCIIGKNVKIGPGCVIGKCEIGDSVEIHANVTIYSKTKIDQSCIIESGTVIGSSGKMWVWDKNQKIYLEQLGGVIIEKNCRIGSLIEIVRGSANEDTIVRMDCCIAHGSMIGHGCEIGKNSHLANGVNLGGGVNIGEFNFIGSGVTIVAGVTILNSNVIIGAGSTVTKNVTRSGVFIGSPAQYIKDVENDMSGIPKWTV